MYLCKMNYKQLIFSIMLLLLAPAAVLAQSSMMEECEDTCTHIHGIDISHYQGEVFWKTIGDNTRMAYVYIKATEGGDRIDKRYENNLLTARKHGLKVGSYHFYRPITPQEKQLKNFTTQCLPHEQDLIPMIDVETKNGLAKCVVNHEKLASDLNEKWEVLAEPIQTMLRKYGMPDAYDTLKALTRGKNISREDILKFAESLDMLSEEDRQTLVNMTPASYIGKAAALATLEL